MAYDALLVLRDGSTDLTASEEGSAVALPGTPIRGLECTVVVPTAPTGTTPTLVVELEACATSGGTYKVFRSYPVTINAAGEVKFRFHLDKGMKYIKLKSTVGGTTPNFGKVKAYVHNP